MPIQSIKGYFYEGADNVYEPEPTYSYSGYGNGGGIFYIKGGQEIFWEFSTILEEYNVTLTIYNNSIYNYPIIISINKTCNSGTFICPIDYERDKSHTIKWTGDGNGYISLNLWRYTKPEPHPEPTAEMNVRNNLVEAYWGLAYEIPFPVDEYDYFLASYKSTKSYFGWGSDINGYSGEAGFLDQAGFDSFTAAMLLTVEGDIFFNHVQAFRPTHNDTWYFVWVNNEDTPSYYNISVRFTENYYNETEIETDPEPNPDTDFEPIWISSYDIFIVIGLIAVFIIYFKKKKGV